MQINRTTVYKIKKKRDSKNQHWMRLIGGAVPGNKQKSHETKSRKITHKIFIIKCFGKVIRISNNKAFLTIIEMLYCSECSKN